MGNRPTSKIIYGFEYIHDWESEEDQPEFYEKNEEWRNRAFEMEGSTTWEEKQGALVKHGQHIEWGYRDDPCHAFGFVFASGDWESAETIDPENLVPPPDAKKKLEDLCKFFGVKPQNPKWLMLTSYG